MGVEKQLISIRCCIVAYFLLCWSTLSVAFFRFSDLSFLFSSFLIVYCGALSFIFSQFVCCRRRSSFSYTTSFYYFLYAYVLRSKAFAINSLSIFIREDGDLNLLILIFIFSLLSLFKDRRVFLFFQIFYHSVYTNMR